MQDMRLNKLAKLLVNYSVGIKKGDFVFITCEDAASPWMKEVAKEAVKAGGHVETLINNADVDYEILKNSSLNQLKEEKFIYRTVLEKADVWLSAWGGINTKNFTNISSEKMQAKSIGARSWRKFYFERMGNGTLRWCGTQFPTYSDAQEADMNLSEYEDFVYGAGHIDMDDPIAEWKKISSAQTRWANYLDTKKEVHIISEGTDIKVNVSGRKWISCDGKENFPDGEIFTSPVDDNINGHITFSFPAIYMGREVEGIELEVKDGKVVSASAKKGDDLLNSLMKTDEGASKFGEVAIGTNYGIKKFTKNILFDEKIGGTVHMALGDGFTEAGGKNHSSIHWDMICDMRKNSSIYADGELFYENGKFDEDILKKYNL